MVNRGQGNVRSSKTQNVSHIAFGSKILGPPPSSNKRVSTRVSGEVRRKTSGSKSNRSCQHRSSGKGTETVQDIERLELSFLPYDDSLDQRGKGNTHRTEDECQNGDFQLTSPQRPSAEKNSHRRLSLKNETKNTWDITSELLTIEGLYVETENSLFWNKFSSSPGCTRCFKFLPLADEWVFPESCTESVQLDGSEQSAATEGSACHNITSPQNASAEHHSSGTGDHQVHNKEIFTFSSRPRPAPRGKSPSMSPECCVFPLDLKQDSNGVRVKSQTEDSFQGTDSSEEEYDWKNYQSNRLSSSELQMLASMKRQQNEELQDTGISHGLSASQIDNCNVSISTTSDDTTTWNSCFPPPVSQEHHYQKEMSPLSHSNPRDWSNVFSPPIIPGSQQLEEHTKSSTNQSIPGEDDLSTEEDEILTLLYDPCLNCYFDPDSGKYYELA
ncbi:Uncharacterized protein C3orf67 [Apaloderma vittatum]|nr:Uncharacterized protein C3orf67 [Apaloderma vittatum]